MDKKKVTQGEDSEEEDEIGVPQVAVKAPQSQPAQLKDKDKKEKDKESVSISFSQVSFCEKDLDPNLSCGFLYAFICVVFR